MDIDEHIAAVNDALDAPLRAQYGTQSPFHLGTAVRWRDGGPNPLDGVSMYWNDVGPHWHYTSQGLSELEEKISENVEVSGWGFELTFRLAAPEALRARANEPGPFGANNPWPAAQAPRWPVEMLDVLAKTVWERKHGFGHGQSIGFGAPPDPERRIVAAGFAFDPQLGTVQTLNGSVTYLQVVGLVDRAELARLRSDEHHDQMMALLVGAEGLYLTRPERDALLR